MTRARDVATQGGLVQVVPTSISVGSGSGSVSGNGAITFTGASTISLNNCFTSTYDNYKFICDLALNEAANGANQLRLRLRTSSGDDSSNIYNGGYSHTYYGATSFSIGGGVQPGTYLPINTQYYHTGAVSETFDIVGVNGSNRREFFGVSHGGDGASGSGGFFAGATYITSNIHTGITFYSSSSGTFTGTIKIYGYDNG
jgi:hypothetical protein